VPAEIKTFNFFCGGLFLKITIGQCILIFSDYEALLGTKSINDTQNLLEILQVSKGVNETGRTGLLRAINGQEK
jgi:hypothetical protein